MNKVERVGWHTEWAMITNKYGKLLSYNIPAYNKLYAECKYQKYISDMIETKEYDVFMDVGAFVGLFSQVAAHNCKLVLSFEGQPFIYGILLNNMKFYTNVVCIYGFVSNKEDTPMINDNFMSLLHVDTKNVPYNINLISLDDEYSYISTQQSFKIRKILIKMDIEGSELKALKGATKLIQNTNVHWIIDVHPPRGVEVEDILPYFKGRKITKRGVKVLIIEGKDDM